MLYYANTVRQFFIRVNNRWFFPSRSVCASRKKKEEDLDEMKEKEHVSKMDAKLLSFTTFFYLVC